MVVTIIVWGITKRWTVPENGMQNRIENGKVVSNSYWFNDFFCSLSINFTFVGKGQQYMVTGFKWNIFVADIELISTHTLMQFWVDCVSICIVERSQQYASI